jgi:hypothetical protein
MSLEIVDAFNGKAVTDEIIRLRVVADTNLRGYALVNGQITESEEAPDEFRSIFIFPDMMVKKGDFVRLHSGEGPHGTRKFADSTTRLFFWGAHQPIWNNNGLDKTTLIKFSVIDSVDVPAAK